ncbi:MAG: VCBS repeat-containing protein [Planctomycetes bacterium]|nr:VCBS repeat-containing protein [Planctomycetota bacterium]
MSNLHNSANRYLPASPGAPGSAGRLCRFFALVTIACVWTSGCERGGTDDFIPLMNRGKAYLENRDSKNAIEVLSRAVRLQPKSAEALRNLARAHRLANQPREALAALHRVDGAQADSATTQYLTALTLMRLSRFEEAVVHFGRAVSLDPDSATLRFQLAGAFQAVGNHDMAREQLQATVRLDPLHASAHFRLASDARKAGDAELFQRHQLEFARLRKLFGDETRSAEALEICEYTAPESAPIIAGGKATPTTKGIEIQFVDATDSVLPNPSDRVATAAAVLDVNEAGEATVFIAGAGGELGLLRFGVGGTVTRSAITTNLPASFTPSGCAIGNFHDDVPTGTKYDRTMHAFNDVALFGPTGLRLLKRVGPNEYRDVTESAGLANVPADRVRWVDYEHDGDLDLAVTTGERFTLWQNNGDGTFRDVTADVGLDAANGASDILAVDLDADVAVDLILARGSESTLVYENQRAGRFAGMSEPPGPWPAASRVVADDLDNDGRPDVVLLSGHVATVHFSKTPTRSRIELSGLDLTGAVLLDYDNDGLVDLGVFGRSSAASDAGSIRLFRNTDRDTSWHDATETTGLAVLDLPPIVDVVPFDFDIDGDSDLLIVTAGGGLRLLRNDGGDANGRLTIRLSTVKTNTTGIGTHIELRDRSWWVTRSVTGPVINVGLGGRKHVDSVQTVWSNGVVDNQVDVSVTSKPLTIVEKNVAVGSCPFLYAWDGHRFRFITDILGNAPIGLSLSRNVILPADPSEFVMIGNAKQFPPHEGAYTVLVTDEFREVLYLDQAKLIAVDHAPGVEVHTTDKLMAPPFPPSELWAMREAKPLRSAVGDDGMDRTEAVRRLDGRFSRPGCPLPPPYRGMCEPMALTLDFGPLDASRPLVLGLTGWLQYGDASVNIAMSQNEGLTIINPLLEVEAPDGTWHEIDANAGMPAGKTKTILCDLTGRLPVGARRLRLTTTLEIRWDRIALFERLPLPHSDVHEMVPAHAELSWRGFSEIKQREPQHPTTPDFDVVSEYPPWRTALSGWCTEYGVVTELTTERDDRLVVVNSGDALRLEFDASRLRPTPAGMERTFFFYSFGWEKDGDHNVVEDLGAATRHRAQPGLTQLHSFLLQHERSCRGHVGLKTLRRDYDPVVLPPDWTLQRIVQLVRNLQRLRIRVQRRQGNQLTIAVHNTPDLGHNERFPNRVLLTDSRL